jgi:hypothetical protein
MPPEEGWVGEEGGEGGNVEKGAATPPVEPLGGMIAGDEEE